MALSHDACTGGDGMNQELVSELANDLELSKDVGYSFERTAQDAIELVVGFLESAIPDDSADDVREALGL